MQWRKETITKCFVGTRCAIKKRTAEEEEEVLVEV